MKVLIFGGNGMLGHKLVEKWNEKYEVWATIRADFDFYKKFGFLNRNKTVEKISIGDGQAIERIFAELRPAVVVNAVGIIKQLPTSKDVIQTLSVNSIFPHQLAELTQKYQARLITVSTDCVFSGNKGNYKESDVPDAADLYGKSKNLGEVTAAGCLTLRTSIIGRELETAHSLVEWFLSNRGKTVKGFVNAIYSGFPTVVLADILSNVIENYPKLSGLYHVSSEPINKYALLCSINEAYDAKIGIEPFEDFRIDRSLDSSRFREATGFQPPEWSEMIKAMAADNALYDSRNRKNL